MAIHKIEKISDGLYRLVEKKKVKDIDGVEVEIPNGAVEAYDIDVEAKIAFYEAQIEDATANLEKLRNLPE